MIGEGRAQAFRMRPDSSRGAYYSDSREGVKVALRMVVKLADGGRVVA